MDQASLIALLNRLRQEPVETEWLEFKASRYEAQNLGEYLSALSNSACVHGKDRGYLVFGVENKHNNWGRFPILKMTSPIFELKKTKVYDNILE